VIKKKYLYKIFVNRNKIIFFYYLIELHKFICKNFIKLIKFKSFILA